MAPGLMMMQAAVALAAPTTPARAGVPTAPAWWAIAARDATLRVLGADAPAAPRRYRFQCVGASTSRAPRAGRYVAQRCIDAEAGIAGDPAGFAARAAAEAARPATTPADRWRRAAWLRAMVLHQAPLATDRPGRHFIVEETVGPGDLRPPLGEPVAPGEIVFEVPPSAAYPADLLRAGVSGVVRLSCRVVGQRPDCRTLEVSRAAEVIRPDGTLAPDLDGRLMLIRAGHGAAQAARVAARTRSGRASEGAVFTVPVGFRIE